MNPYQVRSALVLVHARRQSSSSLTLTTLCIRLSLQSVISVIGRVLEAFDDDNIIPAFGFGDIATKGDRCFPFTANRGCNGFTEVLRRYNEITPTLKLSGPTNFAPVIKEAIRTVDRDGGYHILVIIADGQVTNEEATREAIVEASNWPICTSSCSCECVCIVRGETPLHAQLCCGRRVH